MKQRVIGIYEMESPLARAGGDPLPTLVRRSSPHGVLAFLISDVFEALHRVIDLVNGSTIKEPISNRKRAKQLLVSVWADVAPVVQALSVPPPKFRPAAGNPMPRVRRRRVDEEVADFEPASLPTWLKVA